MKIKFEERLAPVAGILKIDVYIVPEDRPVGTLSLSFGEWSMFRAVLKAGVTYFQRGELEFEFTTSHSIPAFMDTQQ